MESVIKYIPEINVISTNIRANVTLESGGKANGNDALEFFHLPSISFSNRRSGSSMSSLFSVERRDKTYVARRAGESVSNQVGGYVCGILPYAADASNFFKFHFDRG